MTAATQWAAALGLKAPIVCAPMGGVAGGRLASAVSRAGGLGMIGMGSAASRELLARELALLDAGGAPFGVGFVGWGIERDPALLDMALEAGPAVVSVSFLDWAAGDAHGWVAQVTEAGAQAITQVATVDEALHAAEAGVHAVVARGSEAGGHGDHQRPRGSLLAEVLEAVSVPVLSAGAIMTGRDVAAAIAGGAQGAWVGTAFSACAEALTSSKARQVLLGATGADTVVSRVLDVALDRPWPERFPERLLKTAFVDEWSGREDELAHDEPAKSRFREALALEDYSVVPLDAGEGVGALVAERSAAEVLADLTPQP